MGEQTVPDSTRLRAGCFVSTAISVALGVLVFVLLIIAGEGPADLAKFAPDESDMVGLYVPDEQSLAEVKKHFTISESSLMLAADRQAVLLNVPIGRTLVNGERKWKLRDPNGLVILPEGGVFHIKGQRKPYALWVHIGPGDEEALYVRRGSN